MGLGEQVTDLPGSPDRRYWDDRRVGDANTGTTQVRTHSMINTEVTRTKRYSSARYITAAKVTAQIQWPAAMRVNWVDDPPEYPAECRRVRGMSWGAVRNADLWLSVGTPGLSVGSRNRPFRHRLIPGA